VDRFQGHEADVVYLAFVNRRPTYFLQSPNRLNVALTRARYQLVIVGNRRDLAGRDETSLLSKLCYFHLDQTDFPYGDNDE
jgi:superfamily I DNA and/or RNA helicase